MQEGGGGEITRNPFPRASLHIILSCEMQDPVAYELRLRLNVSSEERVIL